MRLEVPSYNGGMRTALILAALLISCRKPEEPPPPPPAAALDPGVADLNWSAVTVTRGGVLAEVRQSAEARHHCVVTGSLGKEKRWTVDACLASRWQLRFPSPDAMSLLVLTPAPDAEDDVVGAVYRAGKRVAVLSQSSLGLGPPGTRVEGGKLSWLGEGDSRTTDDGVELRHVDGTPFVIRFDAVRAGAAAAPLCSPCSYTDAEGTYHVVEHGDDIPARYREQGGRIHGTVQKVPSSPRR